MGLFIVIHVLTCIFLITIILMQSGRGGGLTESFAAAESMFGAKTNEFLIRVTSIGAVIFLVTSLSLAVMSSRRKQSLIPQEAVAEAAKDVKSQALDVKSKVENKAKTEIPQATK